jgi:2-polyprenyl-6-methoxyphenol hydroxylase-like FAD-dependent oxidoreductase
MTAHVRPIDAAAARMALPHVLVIGGGIGGLCLAQGLRKAGVSCAVYERERAVSDRLQGYRVHISPTGSRALNECLPPALFDLFARTCGTPTHVVRFLTERMSPLMTVDGGEQDNADPVARHRSASRLTLRQVLMAGLDGLHFGKTFTHYEERDGRVVAHFDDGSSAAGDVLVAADGGGSRVRRQFLPQAERVDTGVVGIAGKIFLDGSRDRIDPRLLDGIALVATRGLGLFVASHVFSDKRIEGLDAAMPAAAGNLFDNTRSYLMWALSGRPAALGLSAPHDARDAAALLAVAERAMRGWAPQFRGLLELTDSSTVSLLGIHSSKPVEPWSSGRITLLGDAIHSMTPYRGIGANVALRDAARFTRALIDVRDGRRALADALHDYEAAMLDYGFRAVQNSYKAMQQTLDQGAVALAAQRLVFRAIDRLPPLKRHLSKRMGEE